MRLMVVFFALTLFPSLSRAERIGLPVVVDKVTHSNFLLIENAFKIYQARENIQVARGNLLPKLNVWKALSIMVDPIGNFVGAIEDVAPFLVPANWFRFDQAKILLLAQREGYRALWANELMTAKALYYRTLLDQELLETVRIGIKELAHIYDVLKMYEDLGGAKPGAARDVEIRILSLKEDERSLMALLATERSSLSYILGMPAKTELQLDPIEMPIVSEKKPLDYDDFEFRVLDTSPEARQYVHLLQVIGSIESEVRFSFLGSSTVSRGVHTGGFDSLPLSQGAGLGTSASVRITKAEAQVLQLQKKGIEETLRRRLKLIVETYNLDLGNYASMKRRVELSEAALKQIEERIALGEVISALDVIEASRNHMQSLIAFLPVRYRILAQEDHLNRLLFNGDYRMRPAELERIYKK